MLHASMEDDIRQCIELCLQCFRTCRETAMTQCLDKGGRYVEPDHFRLMQHCAELCLAAADLMIGRSRLHAHVCAACAELCEACEESCRELGDLDDCAEICRRCAESCRQMASGSPPAVRQRFGNSVQSGP